MVIMCYITNGVWRGVCWGGEPHPSQPRACWTGTSEEDDLEELDLEDPDPLDLDLEDPDPDDPDPDPEDPEPRLGPGGDEGGLDESESELKMVGCCSMEMKMQTVQCLLTN